MRHQILLNHVLAVGIACLAPLSVAGQIAVRGETVYTAAGDPIKDGVVLLKNGKIDRVGPASRVRIPSDYRTLSARIVTPGLIDAHSVVGLAGHLNQRHDQDQLDKSASIQPELRAIDAYPREKLVEWIRSFGVTTIHTGHGPGALNRLDPSTSTGFSATMSQSARTPSAFWIALPN
jgi:cytosine/adenosine deaminase-related metal-dependent hydrolase